MNLKHHIGAHFARDKGISAKLNRVAQTLFGLQQQGFSGQWLAAPQRHIARHRSLRPKFAYTPFPFGPAFFQSAQKHQAHGFGDMKPHARRIGRYGLIISFDRFIDPAKLSQNRASIVKRTHMSGPYRQGAGISLQSVFVSSKRLKRRSAAVMQVRITRRQRNGEIVILQRLSKLFKLQRISAFRA